MINSRQASLQYYRENPEVSVLIIGGGVNGIGVFRDLALQGIDVLLVEKSDFASGASAASSHMLHGGLRYLENGEFRLVREALHERNLLLKNAPHYAKPLPTTIPIFKWFSGILNAPLKFLGIMDKPSERGAIIIKLGLTMYDWFTWFDNPMPRHKFHSKGRSLQKRPKLNPNIVCTATYYDAWMPYPERLCIEMILDAETISDKAHALNYVSAVNANGNRVTLHDEVSGETFEVQPQIVVNAAGPWIDLANTNMGIPTQFIGGTKGSHIVVDHPELHSATQGHEIFFENEDGRIVLFFPLLDKVLIGTTDIPVNSPEGVICTDEEIDYMLGFLKHVFPTIHVGREHIVYTFSGVRPLPASDASNPGQISRDHSIKIVEPNETLHFPIYSLVGGKWTTFRAFSEQTTEKLLARLRQPRRHSTRHLSIGGGQGYPTTNADRAKWLAALNKETQIPVERLETLLERYGTRAEDIARYSVGANDKPLDTLPTYHTCELKFIAIHEKVVHLTDILQRRSLLAMCGYIKRDAIGEIGQVVGEVLGWNAEQTQVEIENAIQVLQENHRMEL